MKSIRISGMMIAGAILASAVWSCAVAASNVTAHKPDIGEPYCLRKEVPVREVKTRGLWDTYGLVSLTALSEPSQCGGKKILNDGDTLFIQTLDGITKLYLHRSGSDGGNAFVAVPLIHDHAKDKKTLWLSSTGKNGDAYDYYVYLYDLAPSESSIDKVYRLEVFPKAGDATAACNDERPKAGTDDNIGPRSDCVAVVRSQINSGQGGEPGHP